MDQQKKQFKNNGGERKSYGERKPYDKKPYGDKKAYGDKKPYEKKSYGKTADGERKSFEKKPFEKKSFDRKPFDKKFDGEKKDSGEKKSFERKPYGKKPYVKKGFDKKPFDKKPAFQRAEDLSARDVALKALVRVSRENAFAAQALDRELNVVKLSDEDRRLAASLFYTTLENRLRIENLIAAKVKELPEPQVQDILCLAVAQILFMDKIPDHAAVDEAVKQTRAAGREKRTALVNAVLRGLIRSREAGELALPDREAEPEKYISEKYSVALPLVKRLVSAYGVELTEEIAAWRPDRRSDTIRPNRLRMSDAAFEAWLGEKGFDWEKAAVPGAYRVSGAGRLASHEGYRDGSFSIQGESSMLAAYAVCAKPGMQILDACAAPGGKSCLMAEMMRGAGRVHAWDVHEHRVELIQAAAKRLGLENLRTQARDAGKKIDAMVESMDAVLVDAPCSGLGVMGDKPDIKYRLTEDTIDALVPIQKQILDTCASYVCPGGLLVYSTCTILPEENEKQILAFLRAHPEFEPDGYDKWLPENVRGQYKDGMIQILPCRDGLEGFFIARLRRKAVNYGG